MYILEIFGDFKIFQHVLKYRQFHSEKKSFKFEVMQTSWPIIGFKWLSHKLFPRFFALVESNVFLLQNTLCLYLYFGVSFSQTELWSQPMIKYLIKIEGHFFLHSTLLYIFPRFSLTISFSYLPGYTWLSRENWLCTELFYFLFPTKKVHPFWNCHKSFLIIA